MSEGEKFPPPANKGEYEKLPPGWREPIKMDPAQIRAAFERIAKDYGPVEEALKPLQQAAAPAPQVPKEPSKLARRAFFTGAGALGLAAGLGLFEVPKFGEKDKPKPGVRRAPESPSEPAYTESLAYAGLVQVAAGVANVALKRLGALPDFESKNQEQVIRKLMESPVKMTAYVTVLGPFFEELAFRLGPSLAIDLVAGKGAGSVWEVGIPVTLFFADLHAWRKPDGTHTDDEVPLPQFLMGLFFWHLMRQKGFSHAVSAHMFVNALAVAATVMAEYLKKKNKVLPQGMR